MKKYLNRIYTILLIILCVVLCVLQIQAGTLSGSTAAWKQRVHDRQPEDYEGKQ